MNKNPKESLRLRKKWKQTVDFEEGLGLTVDWYLANSEWIINVRSREYRDWAEKNYGRGRELLFKSGKVKYLSAD